MVEQKKRYHAFISYGHSDNIHFGRQWATWLHQSIETYEIPDELVGKKNERGEEIPERIFPVFRDEEALPADSDLTNVIAKALDTTRFLIVICSPNARQSKAVGDEIRYFRKLGKSDQILAAIIDGEPNTSLDEHKFRRGFSPQDECFPKSLQFRNDGPNNQATEPVAADFRVTLNNKKQQGWTSPHALREHLNEKGELTKEEIDQIVLNYKKQLDLMLLKIIAGIIGVPLDDLTRRDKAYQLSIEKQKARRMRKWIGGLVVLSAIAIGAGLFAWQQQRLAKESEKKALTERNQALISQSRYLLKQASYANDNGQHDLALLLGLNAVPGIYGGRRPMPKSVSELRRAVLSPNKQVTIHEAEDVHGAEFNANAREFFVITESPELKIYNCDNGQLLDVFSHTGEVKKAAFSRYNNLLATSHGNKNITVWNRATKTRKYQCQAAAASNFLIFSHDGWTLFSASTLGHLQAWDMATGKVRFLVKSNEYFLDYLCVSKNNELIIGKNNVSNKIYIWSVANGELLHTIEGGFGLVPFYRQPRFTDDNNFILYYNDNGTNIYDLIKKESKELSAQVHTIFNNDGNKFIALPSSNQIQGQAEDILRTESFRTDPMLWDFKEKKGSSLNHIIDVEDAFFTPDNQYLVTVVHNRLNFWNPDTGIKSHSIQLFGNAYGVRVSSDSKRVIAYFTDDDAVGVWKIDPTWKEILFGTLYDQFKAKLSPNGKYAYLPASEKGNKSKIVSTKDPESMIVLKDSCDIPRAVNFSYDEGRIAINCFEDPRAQVVDLSTGSIIYQMNENFRTNLSVLSPNGNYLVSDLGGYAYNDISIVKLEQPDAEPILVDLGLRKALWEIRFSQDSQLIGVQYGKNKLFFIDSDSGKLINSYDADVHIECFAFGRDNQSFYIHHSNNRTIEYSMLDNTPKLRFESTQNLEQIIPVPKYNLVLLISKNGDISFWSDLNGRFYDRIAIEAVSHKYQLSPDQRFVYNNSAPDVAISLADRGIFYKAKQFDIVDIAIDEISDEIILLSGRGVTRIPSHSQNLVDKAREMLSLARRCLTKQERDRYFLDELSAAEKQERKCTY